MSASETNGLLRLDAVENARLLLDQWVKSLAQVLESMTDQRPGVGWQAASGSFGEIGPPETEVLWWEQPFQVAPDTAVWVAAPRAAWEYAGTLTLKAAGLETVEPNGARNTWFEILGQSLSAMARSIGSLLGREVACEAGLERAPDPNVREWASVSLTFAEAPGPGGTPPLLVAFSPNLMAMISVPSSPESGAREGAPAAGSEAAKADHAAPGARTMDLLLDVELPVSISFGKTQLPMRDVLKLTTGSIVELNRGVNEPVEVLVNHCLIARGEVVVVEGNYGVRIQQIASHQDRLRSLR